MKILFKKIFFSAAAFTVSSALLLTGCSTRQGETVAIEASDSVQSESVPTEPVVSSEEITREEAAEADSGNVLEEKIRRVEDEGILLPDESRVPKTSAVEIKDGYWAKFDYAFVRYAKPFYVDSTVAEIYDTEHNCFYAGNFNKILYPDYVKVKTGDQLKNGLKVKDAEMHVRFLEEPDGLAYSKVFLDGSVTWEGRLYCYFEDEFQYSAGDLIFYPNPSVNDFIPLTANF
ncbi:MAG: hypothetical protein NC203_03065, partial [Firmicutes bacterium]|nr:hypothetical protein [Bacillota bacterium]